MKLQRTIEAETDVGFMQVKIYWNSEYKEFQCKFYIDNVRQDDSTYFTDDLEDAIGTATANINHTASYLKEVV